jgi:hypothetical protein
MKITFPKPKFYALLTSVTLSMLCHLQLPALAESEASGPDAIPRSAEEATLAEKIGQAQPMPRDGQTLLPDHKTPETAPDSSAESTGSAESSTATVDPKTTQQAPAHDDTEHPPPEVSPKKTQQLVIKPGQRIKIAGYAEGREVEIIDPVPSKEQPEYHRVYMRLSGSMCFACLHTFEERLKQVLGVERVKIVKGTQVTVQSFSPDMSNWADATIYYDARHVNLPDIRAFSKNNGYVSYRVLDKLADSLPAEEPAKGPWSKKL